MNFYRRMFNTLFNIEFQKPKIDRCDICEEFSITLEPVPILVTKHKNHVNDKEATQKERERDRQSNNSGEVKVCFDIYGKCHCKPKKQCVQLCIQEKIKCVQHDWTQFS